MCVLAACVILTAGCGSDGDGPSSAADGGDFNPPRVAGRVLSTSDQLAARSGGGMFVAILRFLSAHAQAASPGLIPAPGVQVELLRVDESGAPSGAPIDTVTSDADGAFVIDGLPAQGMLMLRASLRTETVRAFVTAENLELTPASELAVRRVESSIQEGERLSGFSRTELAALSGYLEGLRVEAAGTLEETITQLETQAGRQFDVMLDSLRDGDESVAIGDGDHGVIEFTSTLRDPALAPEAGFRSGVDVASGVGMITLDARARAARAFVPRAVFVQDLFADNSARMVTDDAAEDLIPGDDLGDQMHAASANGQVFVLDPERPAIAVTPGAITVDGTLMVHPLAIAVDGPGGLVAAGAGLRFMSRWPEPVFAAEAVTRLDPLGAEATPYHLVRMFHSYSATEAGVTIGAGGGNVAFDSAPQSRAFTGDPAREDYGGFISGAGGGALTLDSGGGILPDSGFATVVPASGLFRMVPGTGLMELRADDDDGTRIGAGVVSADGHVAVMEMAAANEDRVERILAVAIRQSGDGAPPVAGMYHAIEYTSRVRVDEGADEGAFFLGASVRHGMLRLSAEDGLVDDVDLFVRAFSLGTGAGAGGSIEAGAMAETAAVPGTYRVDENGAVRLELTVGGVDGGLERIVAAGAADASGDFIALAVHSEGSAAGDGRGLLLLVRQSGG